MRGIYFSFFKFPVCLQAQRFNASASRVLELKVCVSPPSQDLVFASRTLCSEHSVLHLGPRMPEQSQLAGVMASNWLKSVCMVVGSQLTL